MITGCTARDQAASLAHGPGNPDLTLGFFIRTAGLEFPHQGIGNPGLTEPTKVARLLQGEYGHDAWKNGYRHASRPRAGDEPKVILVIQEQLRGHEIGARRDLTRKETDVRQVVRSVRVTFREARNPYRKTPRSFDVDLQVRGICCLRPKIPGISDNIEVTSIVGRFLEHARIYYFHNGGNEEVYLGSADLMPRNLDKRVEVLFPVQNPEIRNAIISKIIPIQLTDNCKLRVLQSDGTYRLSIPIKDEKPLNAQAWFLEHSGCWYHDIN